MKKKMLTGILAVSMLGVALTGCGNKEVTKIDETQAVITESTQAALEKDLEPATEKTTEATTEAVKADFLAENGLKITPNGSMTIPVAKWDSDELVDLPVTTSVETVVSAEEGYSDTTFTVIADISGVATTGWSYGLGFFDRYTGTDLTLTEASLVNGGSAHEDVAVVDIDGKQYDCSYEANQNDNGGTSTITVKVHHPSEYDGVVFSFGAETKTQKEDSTETSENIVSLDYAEWYYFFTATDK